MTGRGPRYGPMSDYLLERALLPDGWAENVRVEVDSGGSITAVQPDADGAGTDPVTGVVLPGMPNLHSHAFQRAAAGLTECRHGNNSDTFWTWRQVMHQFVECLTPADVETIAAQLYVEMLKAGYTAVAEFHYLHHRPDGTPYEQPAEIALRIASAAGTAGIGLTLLPVLYSVGGYSGADPNPGQRRFMTTVDAFLEMAGGLIAVFDGDGQVRVGVAPHSVRQVPAAALAECVAGITELDAAAPIHIHVAEQVRDVEDHMRFTGARPVAWLLDHAPVDKRWCFVHATHMTPEETAGLALSGAVAGLCPTTEANLGDGLFPLVPYMDAGGRIGIGSDSHVSISPVEELRWLEYGQRLNTLARNIAAPHAGGSTARRLVDAVLDGGAQAMGRPVGAIQAGCRADWIVLDNAHPQLAGRDGDALLDSFVFSGNANSVSDVMVGGDWVVRDGRHANEEAIAGRYRETVRRLNSRDQRAL